VDNLLSEVSCGFKSRDLHIDGLADTVWRDGVDYIPSHSPLFPALPDLRALAILLSATIVSSERQKTCTTHLLHKCIDPLVELLILRLFPQEEL
jgi:hypothetical protein